MKEYEISKDTLAIIPYGINKSKVYERNDSFIINDTTIYCKVKHFFKILTIL